MHAGVTPFGVGRFMKPFEQDKINSTQNL